MELTDKQFDFSFYGYTIRVLRDVHGELWFVAKDMLRALRYNVEKPTKQLISVVPDKWKMTRLIREGKHGVANVFVLTEKGFWFFLDQSESPVVKAFSGWARIVVVPRVRDKKHTTTEELPYSFDGLLDDVHVLEESDKLALTPLKQKKEIDALEILNFEGHEIRGCLDEKGDPWFIAKDVCAILELDNVTRAISDLDYSEKITLTNGKGNPRAGIPHTINLISESGLYALAFKSKKPEAKKFSKWVRTEVLPTLRKTGKYELFQNQKQLVLSENDQAPAKQASEVYLIQKYKALRSFYVDLKYSKEQITKGLDAFLKKETGYSPLELLEGDVSEKY